MSKDYAKFIFLSIFISSCASLTSTNQIISIDSSPRGSDVYLGKNKQKIGTTPLFYKLPRTRKLKLNFKTDKQASKSFNKTCSFRWLVSGLGNLPFFSNPELGLVALTYDVLSENAWHCDDYIKVKLPEKNKRRECYKLFVLAPKHKNPYMSEKIREYWMQSIKEKIDPCHSFVGLKETKKYHKLLGLGNQDSFESEDIKSNKIRKIGLRTEANVFVTLNFNRKNRRTLNADYFDMHTSNQINKFPKRLKLPANYSNEEFKDSIVNFAFELLPNSLSYEAGNTVHFNDTFTENRSEINSLPTYLSSFSLLNIVSPEAYGEWDISYGIYPSLEFFLFHWSYSFENANENFNWRLYYLMPGYEARITFYTALGQWSVGIGLGPVLTYSKATITPAKWSSSSFNYSYLRYSAHFSESLFFKIDTTFFNLKQTYKVDKVSSGPFSEITLGLGYFFPELDFKLFL